MYALLSYPAAHLISREEVITQEVDLEENNLANKRRCSGNGKPREPFAD